MQKLVIAGGAGFIGSHLARTFSGSGWEVVVLSRGPDRLTPKMNIVHWDARSIGDWTGYLEGSSVVVNLAGKSVDCRFTAENKRAILDSRTGPTRLLGEALSRLASPPRLWINASTCGIYRHALEGPLDESSVEYGDDFLASVARQWEASFFDAGVTGLRQVALRFSLVLGPGGVLPVLARLVRLGLGGRQGDGRQMVSWVHLADVLRAVEFVIRNENLNGPVNCTAPQSVSNRLFMQALRKTLHVTVGLPAPAFLLRLGSAVIGRDPDLLLKSQFVQPAKLPGAGFMFRFPDIEQALKDLLPRD